MPGVFISYRHEDASAWAGRIYDRLCARFGESRIFMDVDTIQPGADFVESIRQIVGSCDVLIAVIGREWLAASAGAKRRLDDPHDFVRMEIAAALERNIRVIPVLVAGARMPGPEHLPRPLAPLARRNALEITDTAFRQGVARLIEAVENTVTVQDARPPALASSAEQPQPPEKKREIPSSPVAQPAGGIRKYFLAYRPAHPLGWLYRASFYFFALLTFDTLLLADWEYPAAVQQVAVVLVSAVIAGAFWRLAVGLDRKEHSRNQPIGRSAVDD